MTQPLSAIICVAIFLSIFLYKKRVAFYCNSSYLFPTADNISFMPFKMWREMCFAHDGSIYAVAMIGSSEEDMQMLLDTVAVHDEAPEITAQPDDRTLLERFLGYFFGN